MGAYEVQGIVYVDGVGGDDANDGLSWGTAKKTIGAGIAAAGDGWFVFVADGTYTGAGNKALRFAGKKIYLMGVDHNNPGQRPVMDCERSGRAFIFESGETQNCVIENFAIQNGSAGDGGAIYCSDSSPTLNNCILWGNSASGAGSEIYVRGWGSTVTLNYCCVDNTGYGHDPFGSSIDDTNNCIFVDPLFVDPGNGNYYLQNTSPCIDKGNNTYISGVDKDLDGNPRIVDGNGDTTTVVDIGAYERQTQTWYVDGVGGSDSNGGTDWNDAFATIGKALSEAGGGDTIFVADATYNETDLNFNGKNIHLQGVDYHSGGLTQPVIDCGNSGRAFYFGSGETEDCVVDNFTIKKWER